MSSQKKSLQLFKELLSVLRALANNSSDRVSAYQHTYGYYYVSLLYRNNKKLFNEETSIKDYQFLAQTYLCLVKSVRDSEILYQRYKGAGELSVEKIANRVGFKLPDVPK